MPRPSTSNTKNSKSQVKNSTQPQDLRKRSRRTSAEKPVKYEESPLDDTEEEAISLRKTPVNRKRVSPKEKLKTNTTKDDLKKPKSTFKRSIKSSSDEYEEPTSGDSDIQNKKKII